MKRFTSLIFILFAFPVLLFSQWKKDDFLTPFEESDYLTTPRFKETMEYFHKMAKVSKWIHLTSIGITPEGRNIPLIIVSKDSRDFNFRGAQNSGKAIILIQSGIHAGEIDGKDATMMLVRDMCITKEKDFLLDKTVLLFLPIFNLDGHERFGKFNRINQNGPVEMGWRTTSQNINLNRDYMKADTPEMRAWLKLYSAWLPDFFVDCHVTDGADYQHVLTYSMNTSELLPAPVRTWVNNFFLPSIRREMDKAGLPLSPYVFMKTDRNIYNGLTAGVAPPRFSTEYVVLQNRPGLLIETHMLKDYKSRVFGTYTLLENIIRTISANTSMLRLAVRTADEETKIMGDTANGTQNIPLTFSLNTDSTHDSIFFRGYTFKEEHSDISNDTWIQYTDAPFEKNIPWYTITKPASVVSLPKYYIIPRQWRSVLDVLDAHGIAYVHLTKETAIEAERYTFTNPKWNERPYEGRHPMSFELKKETIKKIFASGSVVVPLNVRNAKVIVGLLEPSAPDALVRWGFFDAIFEQKEYGEDYVLEKLAREMLKDNSPLKKEFDEKLKSDSAFAKNSYERLNFFYQRSTYWDEQKDVYPIVRIVEKIQLPLGK
ncbi:MAG: M14 family metallopeptidase [Bacteroidota bacterium]